MTRQLTHDLFVDMTDDELKDALFYTARSVPRGGITALCLIWRGKRYLLTGEPALGRLILQEVDRDRDDD